MKQENRLLKSFSGDNTDCALNFKPKMNSETLIDGYKNIMATIYSPKPFYERVKIFLNEYEPQGLMKGKIQFYHIKAFIKSMWLMGVRERGRRYYWKLFVSTLLMRPRSFPIIISLGVYGYHFRKVVEKYIKTPIEDTLRNQATEESAG